MRFFLRNLKIMFNYKIILIIAVCFSVNIFYSFPNLMQVLSGVKNGFELYTAIPWISLIFPFFFATGAFFASMGDVSVYVFPRFNKIRNYYALYYLTVVFSAAIYCLFYAVIAVASGGSFIDGMLCMALLIVNLLFIASIQFAVYSIKKNTFISIGVVLAIILLSLMFPEAHFNIGSWGMLVRSNIKTDSGFNVIITTVLQIIFTVISNFIIVLFNKKAVL